MLYTVAIEASVRCSESLTITAQRKTPQMYGTVANVATFLPQFHSSYGSTLEDRSRKSNKGKRSCDLNGLPFACWTLAVDAFRQTQRRPHSVRWRHQPTLFWGSDSVRLSTCACPFYAKGESPLLLVDRDARSWCIDSYVECVAVKFSVAFCIATETAKKKKRQIKIRIGRYKLSTSPQRTFFFQSPLSVYMYFARYIYVYI